MTFCDDVQFGDDGRGAIDFLRWQQTSRAAAELAPGQRTPGQRSNVIGQTLVECSIFQTGSIGEAQLNLIDNKRHSASALERGELRWPKIADSEFTDLSLLLQFVERAGNFFGIHEVI